MTGKNFRKFLFYVLHTPFGLVLSTGLRIGLEIRSLIVTFSRHVVAIFRSREFVNFSYNLNDQSRTLLPHIVARIAGVTIGDAERVIRELETDRNLVEFHKREIERSHRRWGSDSQFKPGRLLLHYALVRLTRPRIVFEAGVDKGLGAIIMNRALQRNRAEGFSGSYIGVEYRADRPAFLFENFPDRIGKIEYSSWSDVMQNLPLGSVDFLFYDAVYSQDHLDKIISLSDRFSSDAILVSAWSGQEFLDLANKMNRQVLTFHAVPKDHWFDGAELCIIHRDQGARRSFQ